jgi:hypothetical protein
MTKFQVLSAGLLTLAMLGSPALARDSVTVHRHFVSIGAGTFNSADRNLRSFDMEIPRVGEGAIERMPGGVCDAGDNERIC